MTIAKTNKPIDVIKLARECDIHVTEIEAWGLVAFSGGKFEQLQSFANAVLEAAAELCLSLFDADDDSCNEAETCAAAIRGMKYIECCNGDCNQGRNCPNRSK